MNPALATVQAGHLIGLTIAHEVGHVLGLRHSASGVMKARLEIDDLRALRMSRLAFSSAPPPPAPPPWPCRLVIASELRPSVELAWEQSPTFKSQCERLADASTLVLLHRATSVQTPGRPNH